MKKNGTVTDAQDGRRPNHARQTLASAGREAL